ncbi:conserved hypothetical protein [Burkholderia vietnamiensis]|nr:conserved hypothetical protein [Burkholderia vietnamiensis]SOT46017.1 hypothetical protein F01_570003 [Burkholderia cenocepacia]
MILKLRWERIGFAEDGEWHLRGFIVTSQVWAAREWSQVYSGGSYPHGIRAMESRRKTVGVVAPAGVPDRQGIEHGIALVESGASRSRRARILAAGTAISPVPPGSARMICGAP